MSKKTCDKIECAKRTSIGGQALIEGIMMRGPQTTAMAVRDPDGNIILEKWETKMPKRAKFFKLPIVRGMFNFIDSMRMGYKCLMRSAEIAGLEEEEPKAKKGKGAVEDTPAEEPVVAETVAESDVTEEKAEVTETANEAKEAIKQETDSKGKTDKKDKKEKDEKKDDSVLMAVIMVIATVLGVALAIGLFFMLPSFIYEWSVKLIPALRPENDILNSLVKSVFEGVLKIVILVAYMALVSLMKDIRRTFQYHGAEHKTIFCYENGLELTVENVRRQRRFHPRCGTSFLILMLIVGIFISFFIDPLFLLAL
ncbi:MAG: DUF1385 domain-containing protein, partial [Clostridia bacterium]|nr:DUF1385 domain-containing protein [Clostridia bacterium]